MADEDFTLAGTDTLKIPGSMLAGQGWADHLATGIAPSRVKLVKIYLSPGARTSWHKHPAGQLLHVVTGNLLVQERGKPARNYRPGETASCTPGEWHWHGADPVHFTIKLAVVEADETDQVGVWGEMVTDEEYAEALRQALSDSV
jgi:quercetin dioxygenase-like cupin family protein